MTDRKPLKTREAHIPNRRNEYGELKFPMGEFEWTKIQELQEEFRKLDLMGCIELIDCLAGMVYEEVSQFELDRFDSFTDEDKADVEYAMIDIQDQAYRMTDGPIHRYYNLD